MPPLRWVRLAPVLSYFRNQFLGPQHAVAKSRARATSLGCAFSTHANFNTMMRPMREGHPLHVGRYSAADQTCPEFSLSAPPPRRSLLNSNSQPSHEFVFPRGRSLFTVYDSFQHAPVHSRKGGRQFLKGSLPYRFSGWRRAPILRRRGSKRA